MNRFPVMSHVSPARLRVARFLNAVFALLIISLVLQVAGGFSPGWMYLTTLEGMGQVHMGLWYIVVCVLGTCVCMPSNGAQPYVQTSFHLNQYRGETVSAIVFCFVAAIVLRLCRNRLHNPSSPNVQVALSGGGIFALASGVLATVAAGKFWDFNVIYKAGTADLFVVNFPYSLIVTGAGGLLALIACIVFLASQPWRISAESQPSQMQANHSAPYPAQITTVHAGFDQPQMFAMSAPTEKGPSAPFSSY